MNDSPGPWFSVVLLGGGLLTLWYLTYGDVEELKVHTHAADGSIQGIGGWY